MCVECDIDGVYLESVMLNDKPIQKELVHYHLEGCLPGNTIEDMILDYEDKVSMNQ